MNLVGIFGEVVSKDAVGDNYAAVLNVDDWKKTGDDFVNTPVGVPLFLTKKNAERFGKYVEIGGKISVSGKLKFGKKGLYVAVDRWDVGSLKPFTKDGEAPKKPKAATDDLPF